MSGHSKWATIRRKKGKADAERGKTFTRHIKEITVAAREGGGDPVGNPRLRSAIAAAKVSNMPADNIKRAIQKGTGELPGVSYESITYEGYGPAGVAIYIEVFTDNKNRVVAEIRHILSKYGGNLGANGCVSWMFEKKGIITVELDAVDEDTLIEIATEAGAEDIVTESGSYEVIIAPNDIDTVRSAIEAKNIPMASAEVTMRPTNSTRVDSESEAGSLLKMLELLEDNDDIQKVYTNFDIDESILEKLAG
ncbi:MAG: YebC/PmpR family DNA-binding transcriptional regulator [Candidatus Zixiibacteriota bacterium]|nr:MAG: YebC/PmpR family DNA-binding transcriptional regulator [candidate division Zixibacteria bacterium]